MGQAIIKRKNSTGNYRPVIDIDIISKSYIRLKSDTVLNVDDININNFILNVDSTSVELTNVVVEKLRAKLYYLSAINGEHKISTRVLGNAFKYRKPNSKLVKKIYNIIGYVNKVTNITIEPLSVGRINLAATHVGNYALFAGGRGINFPLDTVDAYSSNLTKVTSSIEPLSVGRENLASTHVGNYAIFAGGNGARTSDIVDVYDINLTWSTPEEMLSVGRFNLVAAHVGNYALFAGGRGINFPLDTVDVYDINLTRSAPAEMLTYTGDYCSGTHNNYYAIFCYYIGIDAYNSNLIKITSSIEPLSVAREKLAATHVGNYTIIAGGYRNNRFYDTVDVYNSNLTKVTSSIEPLSVARENLAATHVDNYAIFAGGYSWTDIVDVYDINLIKTNPEEMLSDRKESAVATHVGNYAIFAGGFNNLGSQSEMYRNSVDVYTV